MAIRWKDVKITDKNGNVLSGVKAQQFVQNNRPDAIENITKTKSLADVVRVKLPDGKTSLALEDIKKVLSSALAQIAKDLTISEGKIRHRVDFPVARAVQNRINVVPALLQMYLDIDRDGSVDNVPANHKDWTWGVNGHGAVVVVKTKTYLAAAAAVTERLPIEFRWGAGPRIPNWQATLSADYAGRIRVYRQQAEGAALINLPCNFNTLGAEDAPDLYRLWVEAIDFPESNVEAEWLIKLDFKLDLNGAEKNRQTAVLRIAPWIMASDLDPTHRVFVRTTTGIDEPLPDAIEQWVGANCQPVAVAPDQSKKGFARDIMKSGYTSAPHFSGVVIQKRLDTTPLFALPDVAAANIGGGCILKPNGLQENQMKGQDNGGNLLVSPPSLNYPNGRILFGGNDTDKPCNSEAFYRAQKVQNPIRLNSTWLRVGHVDEMLSFVRCQDGSYRAVLLSLRLAYIMLRGVASRADLSADALINWAVGVNNQCIGDGVYTEGGLTNRIGVLPANVPVQIPAVIFEGIPVFDGAPPVPVNLDRYVVARVIGTEFAAFMQPGGSLVGQSMLAYRNAFPEGRDFYELRVHSRRFLDKANDVLLHFLSQVQPLLDGVRATLINDLGFTNDTIIEVPVLLNAEGTDYVALTGDSVNLLQIAGNPASRCLVPKPFGPIFAGEYVFERYLADQFAAINVPVEFLAADKFHVNEGEIHCGTNQTHPALQGNRRSWWEMV